MKLIGDLMCTNKHKFVQNRRLLTDLLYTMRAKYKLEPRKTSRKMEMKNMLDRKTAKNLRGKSVKEFVFTQVEKISYDYKVLATSWADAQKQIDEEGLYEFKDYDSHNYEGEGVVKRGHINRLQNCAMLGMKQTSPTTDDWQHTGICTTVNSENYNFTENPTICDKCMRKLQQGWSFTEFEGDE